MQTTRVRSIHQTTTTTVIVPIFHQLSNIFNIFNMISQRFHNNLTTTHSLFLTVHNIGVHFCILFDKNVCNFRATALHNLKTSLADMGLEPMR